MITRLYTDSIQSTNDHRMTLIYAGTQDGQVLKLVQKKKGDRFILLTSWILEENGNERSPVRNLVLAQVRRRISHHPIELHLSLSPYPIRTPNNSTYRQIQASINFPSINAAGTCFARSASMIHNVTTMFNRIVAPAPTRSKPDRCSFRESHCIVVCFSNPKLAIARLQPESWCKKSVQRPSKSRDAPFEKSIDKFLCQAKFFNCQESEAKPCGCNAMLVSICAHRSSGAGMVATFRKHRSITFSSRKNKVGNLAIALLQCFIGCNCRFNHSQHEHIPQRSIYVLHWPSTHRFVLARDRSRSDPLIDALLFTRFVLCIQMPSCMAMWVQWLPTCRDVSDRRFSTLRYATLEIFFR